MKATYAEGKKTAHSTERLPVNGTKKRVFWRVGG